MFQKMLLLPSKYQLTHPSAFTSNRFLLDANNAISNAINVFITLTRDSLTVLGLTIVLIYLKLAVVFGRAVDVSFTQFAVSLLSK